jgi:hypothetical protein
MELHEFEGAVDVAINVMVGVLQMTVERPM